MLCDFVGGLAGANAIISDLCGGSHAVSLLAAKGVTMACREVRE
jgi:hypothetical protein